MKNGKLTCLNLIITLTVLVSSHPQAFQNNKTIALSQINPNLDGCVQIPEISIDQDFFPHFDQEPPILSLGLSVDVQAAYSDNPQDPREYFLINKNMNINVNSSSNSGAKLFSLCSDGLIAHEAGIYRITYNQKMEASDQKSQVTIFLNDSYLNEEIPSYDFSFRTQRDGCS